jgi:hypothetical protein
MSFSNVNTRTESGRLGPYWEAVSYEIGRLLNLGSIGGHEQIEPFLRAR